MNTAKPVGYIYKSVFGGDNGRHFIYVGQHQHHEFCEDYKGSGKVVRDFCKTQGKHLVKTTLLRLCYTREELRHAEIELIAKYSKRYPSRCVNITRGGDGVFTIKGKAPHAGKTWYTDGVTNVAVDTDNECPPKKFEKGFTRDIQKSSFWTDGVNERKIPVGTKPPKGWVKGRSQKTKDKISRNTKKAMTDEVKAKISKAANRPSELLRRREPKVFTQEHLDNMRAASQEPERRAKLSAALKGKPKSEEHKEKLRGQKRTDISKKLMSLARQNSKFYNNGTEQVRLQPGTKPPKGFVEGFLPYRQVECPVCKETFPLHVANRNHFDRCKHATRTK